MTGGNDGRTAAAWTPRRVTDELRAVLEALAAAYGAMLATLEEQAAAISRADAPAIGRCAGMQEQLLGQVSKLDLRRREVLAGACSCLPSLHEAARRSTLTVTQVATALPTQDGAVITLLSEQLRSLINEAKRRSDAIRAASVTMLAHVEGLMRQVGKRMSHSGTYGRRGVVEAGQQVVSSLDMKS
jgi:FlgN protein